MVDLTSQKLLQDNSHTQALGGGIHTLRRTARSLIKIQPSGGIYPRTNLTGRKCNLPSITIGYYNLRLKQQDGYKP